MTDNNQNSKHTEHKIINMQNEKRKLKTSREKDQVSYKGRPIRITNVILSRDFRSQKRWDRCSKNSERPQMLTQQKFQS